MIAKTSRPRLPIALAALAACVLAAPLAAANRSGGDLSLVPADSSTVAVVRLSDLRESPLASKLFADADRMTADGDAARFLEEAQLNPKKDVDVVVIAAKAAPGRSGAPTLVTFEGRFDPDRLAAAALTRGAVKTTTPAGDYYRIAEKHGGDNGRPSAVAFVGPNLVIAGTESAVAQALLDRQAGGTGFASGSGLGRELKRVDQGATVWALVDVNRYPSIARQRARVEAGEGTPEPAMAILGAMKSVSLIAVQAKASGDSLELSATGLSSDAETRQLLEDSLRGLMAMWRLAAQEKSPEIVSVLRKFTVSSDADSVSIRGTLPGSLLRTFAAHSRHKNRESD